ncbi:MAG TPA: DUF4388 domain-containing protein [Actinomycetota bacterium]|nr:DUF4388 domain-containing protein [Actinomycetota bacterium]
MLKGTLDDFTLSDVFRLLAYSKKTGKLDVARSAGSGSVFFRDGYVYFASSGLNLEPLGRRLLRSGVLKERHLRKALDHQATSGERLGRILVATGAIRSEHLEAAVREQIEDAAFELLRWEIGEFEWHEGATFDAEIAMSVTVESLIMEAARRVDELDVIARKIHSVDVELALVAEPPEGARELKIHPDEWRVLVLVDGRSTVRDIVRRSPFDNFMTLRTLYGLIATGLVEVLSEPQHRPRDARPDAPRAAEPPARVEEGLEPEPAVPAVTAARADAALDASLEDELRVALEPDAADGDDVPASAPSSDAALDASLEDELRVAAPALDDAADEAASAKPPVAGPDAPPAAPELGDGPAESAEETDVVEPAAEPAWDAADPVAEPAWDAAATAAGPAEPSWGSPEPAWGGAAADVEARPGGAPPPPARADAGVGEATDADDPADPAETADADDPADADTSFADLFDDAPPAPPAPRAITLPDEAPSRVDRADVVRELAGLFSEEEPTRSRPSRPDAPSEGDGDGGGRGGLMSRFGRRPG